MYINAWRENAKMREPDSFSSAQWQDQRPWAQSETQEVLSECQKTHFYHEGDWALAWVLQRGWGVFILEDTQKPSGHNHGQLACRWLCLNRNVEQDDLQLEPFCDSAILRTWNSWVIIMSGNSEHRAKSPNLLPVEFVAQNLCYFPWNTEVFLYKQWYW